MSIPTFNSTALVSGAARDVPGSPDVRLLAETLPGVRGQYVQPHGAGGREIKLTGILEADGETPPAAHQALKAALRYRQALVDGTTVGAYVGADAATYANCMLTAYEADGPVGVTPGQSSCRAFVPVAARILHLTP